MEKYTDRNMKASNRAYHLGISAERDLGHMPVLHFNPSPPLSSAAVSREFLPFILHLVPRIRLHRGHCSCCCSSSRRAGRWHHERRRSTPLQYRSSRCRGHSCGGSRLGRRRRGGLLPKQRAECEGAERRAGGGGGRGRRRGGGDGDGGLRRGGGGLAGERAARGREHRRARDGHRARHREAAAAG